MHRPRELREARGDGSFLRPRRKDPWILKIVAVLVEAFPSGNFREEERKPGQ